MSTRKTKPDTVLTHAGRNPSANYGMVNPPVYHASTVLFDSMDDLSEAYKSQYAHYTYGRVGTPTSRAFEEVVTELEGGHAAVSASSGLSAIALALDSFTKAGDHVLIADSVYAPTRNFCDKVLSRRGVVIEYYDPLVGADIDRLVRPETSLIFMESPGSLTFEIQDVPAIASVARRRGIVTIIDNTWATPLFFKPFEHGVDVSLHAATKYMVGHADAMLGVVVCATQDHFLTVKKNAHVQGICAGPDDLYLGQRGLRSMAVRLRHHEQAALEVARWLRSRPEVDRVLHPALPDDPGHALWSRDFTGSCGLFSFVLKPFDRAAVNRMVDHMDLFGIGFSWGGFESLITPQDPSTSRSVTRWEAAGPLVRLHIGLEDIEDLKADLEAGLRRLSQG
ncbi:MAG: cystathionine beta-lyase [Pseudomonadota bacterium]